MVIVKKLSFSPLFLLIVAFLSYQIIQISSPTFSIFSLGIDILIQIIVLLSTLILASTIYIIFLILADNWLIILPVSILGSVLPVIFNQSLFGLIIGVGFLVSFTLIYIFLKNVLKTYLDFRPTKLITPEVKNLVKLLILAISIGYFVVTSHNIATNGFKIPDSLINSVLNFVPQNINTEGNPTGGGSNLSQFGISQSQIDELKNNPQLLKQAGIDPSLLDSLNQVPGNNSNTKNASLADLYRQTIQSQFDGLIKPYQRFIAPFLAILFYFTLISFASLLGFLISPLIWLIFKFLETTKFITYTTEMREVKKLII